jgi:Protein of unknown function (DUF1186)/SEC-C motif
MKKEEAEAVLGHEDVGPIENYLHLISTEEYVPTYAIGMCLIRMEEAAPPLRAILARAANGERLSEEQRMLLLRGVYILGGARDIQSCEPLLRLLRLPQDELDDLLGDALTEGMPRIIAGVFDGNVEALFALVADRSADPFAREAALDAAIFLTWIGSIERDRLTRLLERFYEERLAEDDDPVWESWVRAIALLGLRNMVGLVHRGWNDGRILDWAIGREEFEEILAEAEQRPGDVSRMEEFGLGYIEDVAEALAWSDHRKFDEEDELSDEDIFYRGDLDLAWTPSEPVRNPWRDIGRNDPCPCGSGKKFKKCCLAKQG